jgi:hypothetical protein
LTRRILNAVKENASTPLKNSEPKKRMSMRELTKKYGWTAFGVYWAISAVDLPICFLVVHSMGEEKVMELEHKVKGWFGFGKKDEEDGAKNKEGDDKEVGKGNNSNWHLLLTEFGIAYAIHKSFIFLRIPATAALTPWAVRTLQKWGFNIGGNAMKTAATGGSMGTAATTKQKWTSWFF